MRELGWVEGKNFVLDARYPGSDPTTRARFAYEPVASRVDVIFCVGVSQAEAARQATASIPIVGAVFSNPVERGLIASYVRPGGNVTGVAWDQSAELAEKYPELLREAIPGLRLMGCLFDASFPGLEFYRKAIEHAAQRIGVDLFHADYHSDVDLYGVDLVEAIARGRLRRQDIAWG